MRARKSGINWGAVAALVFLVLMLVCANFWQKAADKAATLQTKLDEALETVSIKEAALREMQESSYFDTSILEGWCGGGCDGEIRMTGAWVYGKSGEGGIIVCDETGNLWDVGAVDVTNEDFLLIWIADNNTENVTDDIVVKVWVESAVG
jgi:hypothetical protein